MPDADRQARLWAMLDLIESAEALSADYDDEVADAMVLAQEEPLPAERARPLYARVLKTIRPERSDEDIAAEVEEILAAGPERPAD